MINNLNDLKKSLSETIPDSFKKDDLQTFAKETTKSIPVTLDILQDILPILKDDKINDIDGYILLEQIASELGIKNSDVKSVILYLVAILENFKKESAELQKHIVDMNDIVIKDNIKLRDAAVYRIFGDMYFINRYSLDIANYVLALAKIKKQYILRGEDVKLVSDAMITDQDWYKTLESNSYNFSDILVERYVGFKADSIKDSEFDTIVPLKSYESDGFLKTIIDKILGKKKPIQILGEYNFRYSPIFWIGKMYIKSQVAKAKSMKDKQEMLKYKILDIKAMAEDGLITNEKLEKAIAHYQKEIDNYEYKINKILDN